jgi:multidrug resistance protein, MATE family
MQFNLKVTKDIIMVSLPLMGGMVGNLIMMFVDRLCLARYSQETLAASGPAVFTAMTIVLFFTGFVGVNRSYVAQAHGRYGLKAAERESSAGILISIFLICLLWLISPFVVNIPYLSSRPADIVELERIFLRWSIVFGSVMILNISMSTFFSGIGKTKIVFYIGILGQVVDIPFTIGLVFGKFGLPELGMAGSAIGTLAGCSAMLVAYLFVIPPAVLKGVPEVFKQIIAERARNIIGRLRKGLSTGSTIGLDELGQTAFIWIVGLLGAVALAANNINLSLNFLGIIPIIGLGTGCNILTARAVGSKDFSAVAQIIKTTLAIELVYVVFISFFQIFMTEQLLMPFGLDQMASDIIPVSISTAHWLWAYAFAFIFSMTGVSTLQSFGVTRFPLVTRIVATWCLSLPIIFFVAKTGQLNPEKLKICWIIGAVFELLIGIVLMGRLVLAIKHKENQIVLSSESIEQAAVVAASH